MSSGTEETKAGPPLFEGTVHTLSGWLGSTPGLLLVLAAVTAWLLSRPLFESRQDWQDLAIVPAKALTFVLIFLLQRSQNKAVLTLQLKLNEVIASQQGASNRLIALENLSEAEVAFLQRHYQSLATSAQADDDPGKVHSVEEAAGAIGRHPSREDESNAKKSTTR